MPGSLCQASVSVRWVLSALPPSGNSPLPQEHLCLVGSSVAAAIQDSNKMPSVFLVMSYYDMVYCASQMFMLLS